jgi:CheY-like chemotaxis protein
LLNNAAKYMDQGGHIWITATLGDQIIQVAVKDTGIGIPVDMLPNIFEMFTQVNRTSRQAQGGLGIGLSLVKMLTELHHGQIEVRSKGVGRGSEFIVTLPIIKTTAPTAPKPVPRASILPNRRVLVVDDNKDAGESLSLLLSLLGVESQVVSSGEAALIAIDEFHPTVVILDIGMPGMDGYETARQIRRKPGGSEFLLIALTGWGQEEDRVKSSQAGFNYHLVKPADVNALESLLMTLGDGKRSGF